MAKEEIKKAEKKQTESKVMEGFKFGFGFYIAFLAGSIIVSGLAALIWMLLGLWK